MGNLAFFDYLILALYGIILLGMGFYFARKMKTAGQFMTANGKIPGWAAGLAVMSAYTSSISYIATPGKAFDSDWHPIIFALCMIPVSWLAVVIIIPLYRKLNLISVYTFLEERLGSWARLYAAFSFLLFMVGRMAVILYLVALLIQPFVGGNLIWIIIVIGFITILYTLMGGVEAVIWTDVMQSIVMIAGIIYTVVFLGNMVFLSSPELFSQAYDAGKFSWGLSDFSFDKRTIWVMIIYGFTENLRNLLADQNYVQKYATVQNNEEAAKSMKLATIIYLFLTVCFLFIGTALFYFYQIQDSLPSNITKGDQVFPYFIATQMPVGLKGLILAAIIAAAMSTVDSALNCSATVIWIDFLKGRFDVNISEKKQMFILQSATWVWGILGTLFAIWMIQAKSALDVWWQLSGIFGGGILGLFLLALLKIKLSYFHGLVAISLSIIVISWSTFSRNLPESISWLNSSIDPILSGVLGTIILLFYGIIIHVVNRKTSV
ncbi:MAG: sodium/solute symporter [Saprospiraceae bacterium]|jgi:SSS family solute:Na+ symporter|nr:sodium/solute symporter [Saprospiraceae bacterium]